jgi:hypothetical protein
VISAFNTVYTALQGFFSRSFWFSAFLPVAIFSALHAGIAVMAIGSFKLFEVTVSWGQMPNLAGDGAMVIVVAVLIAYALLPLLPRFRGLLDGSQLPEFLHDPWRAHRLVKAEAILQRIGEARDDLASLALMNSALYRKDGELRSTWQTGAVLTTATNAQAVKKAKDALTEVRRALYTSELLNGPCTAAVNAVVTMLKANNPDVAALRKLRAGSPISEDEIKIATDTDAVSSDLVDLISRASRETEYRYQIISTRYRIVGALDNPRATLIGDARRVTERYAWDVYQVDFNFLWPRLLLAIKAEKVDDAILDTVESARSTVDFAVMSLVLAASIPLVWLPILLVRGTNPWLFFAIGISTPPLLGFLYQLVFEGQLAFGEVVKTAIDRYRFLVFKMLHLSLPLSRSEERRLWTLIAKAEEDGRTADLAYVVDTAGHAQ